MNYKLKRRTRRSANNNLYYASSHNVQGHSMRTVSLPFVSVVVIALPYIGDNGFGVGHIFLVKLINDVIIRINTGVGRTCQQFIFVPYGHCFRHRHYIFFHLHSRFIVFSCPLPATYQCGAAGREQSSWFILLSLSCRR